MAVSMKPGATALTRTLYLASSRAHVFVDSLDTTVDHIGELKIPIAAGAFRAADIIADFYAPETFHRRTEDEITLFKNGGGAHLDLMTSRYILDRWRSQP